MLIIIIIMINNNNQNTMKRTKKRGKSQKYIFNLWLYGEFTLQKSR